jgi:hypothetical protein
MMNDAFIPSHTNNTDINLFSNPFDLARQIKAANTTQ